jgi:hypothetical protein
MFPHRADGFGDHDRFRLAPIEIDAFEPVALQIHEARAEHEIGVCLARPPAVRVLAIEGKLNQLSGLIMCREQLHPRTLPRGTASAKGEISLAKMMQRDATPFNLDRMACGGFKTVVDL